MKKITLLLLLFLMAIPLFAQTFEAGLQLRPRFEYRDGYKTLLTGEQEAATFISQRSRIILGYSQDRLRVKFSGQNIRTWGDVLPMATADKNGFSIFEAYGEYAFNESFKFRLGRQVLSYDNQRIMGEVNWAQQGQSHDAALFTWNPATNQRLDVGAAYNAEGESLVELPYRLNTYQNMQFAWYHLDFNKSGLSFLFLNTGYEQNSTVQSQEIEYIQTFGSFYGFKSGEWTGDLAVYGQTGKKLGRDLSAWYAGANLTYSVSENWKTGIGAEYLSGTDMEETSGEINSFTPLFGTNHGFNGHMDYFFAGNHQNTVGLVDLYGKIAWATPKLEISVMPHYFSSAANMINSSNNSGEKYLGTEIDVAAAYKIAGDLSVSLGYSQMFGSSSLEILKGGDKDKTQNWAWVMVNFSPTLFSFTPDN